MSRGVEGRTAAWQAWVVIHLAHPGHGLKPRIGGFLHRCGAATAMPEDPDYSQMVCSGCSFEISHPEHECEPLYA